MDYVKVIREDRLRVVKANENGKRIGKLYVTFPRDMRLKEGQMFQVEGMRRAITATKKYWVALKRKNIKKFEL